MTRPTKHLAILLLFLAAGVAASTATASVIVVDDAGTQQNVSSVVATIEGDDMVGMLVTATFFDGTIESKLWAATGAGAGAATGTSGGGWSLSLIGDTFFADWVLVNNQGSGLLNLTIDALAGGIVFDQTFGGNIGTPDSSSGFTFGNVSPFPYLFPAVSDVTATYRDLVAVVPNGPVGDLYARLSLDFSGPPLLNLDEGFPSGGGPGGLYDEFHFRADTDQVQAVPEPATLGLSAVGLVGIGAWGWRRRRRGSER